ncbi:MAG: hypothetical protein P8O03_00540 [Ilumatobacter sp.]|jgi:hypothetical protein|nr:hypothetical protein [Ilumatobacter sp.]
MAADDMPQGGWTDTLWYLSRLWIARSETPAGQTQIEGSSASLMTWSSLSIVTEQLSLSIVTVLLLTPARM